MYCSQWLSVVPLSDGEHGRAALGSKPRPLHCTESDAVYVIFKAFLRSFRSARPRFIHVINHFEIACGAQETCPKLSCFLIQKTMQEKS